MTKLYSTNLEPLLAYRKARRSRVVSVSRSVFRNLVDAVLDTRPDDCDRYKRPADKIVWFIIRSVTVLGALFMMLDFTLVYKRSPTYITPETLPYPMENVDFPAIAICNVNRISRESAINLAQELMGYESIRSSFTNLTLPHLTHMLSLLGQLYLYQDGDADIEPTKHLHTILERAFNNYTVNGIMRRLAPKCKSMLRKCSWRGNDVMCDDIFVLRKTRDGYCCTFNYARRKNGFGRTKDDAFSRTSKYVERAGNIGSEYGLSVLLDPQLDDYFYKILPINGFKVSAYSPMNHPDVTSGQVREVLISSKTETFVELDAIVFYTTEDVREYDVGERDCLFLTEQSKIFHGYYSFSDCIVYCRLRDIFRLCGCVPFFYPRDLAFDRNCNLKDLSCLTKYRERWKNVKPRFKNVMTPFDESKFEGLSAYLSCDCLPSCTDVTYNLQSNSLPLTRSSLLLGRYNYSIENDSLVHIYFRKTEAMRLRQDVLFRWYEVMSNYGGVCNLFLGVSVINVIGVLYRLIIRIWGLDSTSQTTERTEGNQDGTKVTTIKVESPKISKVIQPLHWEELTGNLRTGRLNSSHLLLDPVVKR